MQANVCSDVQRRSTSRRHASLQLPLWKFTGHNHARARTVVYSKYHNDGLSRSVMHGITALCIR
jgi:hypothetical protein